MTSGSTPSPYQGPDRRRHHGIREIFEEAVELLAPFFEQQNAWGHHTLDHLAYRSLRETYPQLSFEEAHILVVAARRVHADRKSASEASSD